MILRNKLLEERIVCIKVGLEGTVRVGGKHLLFIRKGAEREWK
jgi:hypothetical protein